jgi:cyclophilin family peptidyl-prolyl cis-trans isomerase
MLYEDTQVRFVSHKEQQRQLRTSSQMLADVMTNSKQVVATTQQEEENKRLCHSEEFLDESSESPTGSRRSCRFVSLTCVFLSAATLVVFYTNYFTRIMSTPPPSNDVAWYELEFFTPFDNGNSTKVTFILECYRDWAPVSFERFATLVEDGFLHDQYLVRAIPDFVLDFNYGPTGGNGSAQEWQHYQDLSWFGPNMDEPKWNATQQSNAMGTITFGQEDDGRTKTEVFVNIKDNQRLDELGFWPFGRVVKTIIVADNGTASDSDATTVIFTRCNQDWTKQTQEALQMKYGDIYFADGADEKKAQIRQNLLIAGGNDYIARQFPGMSQLKSVKRLDAKPDL